MPPKRIPPPTRSSAPWADKSGQGANGGFNSLPGLPSLGHRQSEPQTSDEYNRIDATLLGCGLDRMSLRSKSPDDNSSLFSVSSLDSALNHSREEDELKALTADTSFNEQNIEEGIDNLIVQSMVLLLFSIN